MKRTILLLVVVVMTFLTAAAQHTPADEKTAVPSKTARLDTLYISALDLIDNAKAKKKPETIQDAVDVAYDIVEKIYKELKAGIERENTRQATAKVKLDMQEKSDSLKLDTLQKEIVKVKEEGNELRAQLAAFNCNPNNNADAVNADLNNKIKACDQILREQISQCINEDEVYTPLHVRRAKAACEKLAAVSPVNPILQTTIEMCPQWYNELQELQKAILAERKKSPATFAAKAAEFEAQVDNSAYVVAVKQQTAQKVKSLNALVAEIKKSLKNR